MREKEGPQFLRVLWGGEGEGDALYMIGFPKKKKTERN